MKFHKFAVFLLSVFLTAAAYGGLINQSGSRLFVSAGSDTTPNAFSFTDQTSVATSTVVTSAGVTISGIDTSITCSVSGGTSPGIDVGADANWQTSRSVSSGNSIRVRHTSSASNSTATNTVADCNGVSDTFTSTTVASGGTVLFNPGDLGGYATHDAIFTVDTNDHDGGISSLQSAVTRPGGSSKAIRIQYPNEEAGTQLMFPAFAPTTTLYIRWYMMLDSNWSGNLPVGLKISRAFTNPDFTAVVPDVGVTGDAYASPKLWNKYADGVSGFVPDGLPGDPNATYFWGYCAAIMDLDIGAGFSGATNFDNGLPYVRPGVWYSYEIFLKVNSADGVPDGEMEVRVDGVTIYHSTTLKYVDTARQVVRGLEGFESMWFGGNYSGGDYGRTTFSPALNRYEDGYYVKTTAEWLP